jgi:hypothetical protein
MRPTGSKRSDITALLTAPRRLPTTSLFNSVDGKQIEMWGFRKEKESFGHIPDAVFQKVRDTLIELKMQQRQMETPTMDVGYYIAHHVLQRRYSTRDCEFVIRKLAAQARKKLRDRPAHAAEAPLEELQVQVNEREDVDEDERALFSDDEGDAEIVWPSSTPVTEEEAEFLQRILNQDLGVPADAEQVHAEHGQLLGVDRG